MSDELNQLKLDIALIKKDIHQIERFFRKIDETVQSMSDIAKDLAVQEQINVTANQKLEFLDKKIEEHTRIDIEARLALKEDLEETKDEFRREIKEVKEKESDRTDEVLEKIDLLMKHVDDKIDKIDQRVGELEKVKWYAMGALGAVLFIIAELSFDFLNFMG